MQTEKIHELSERLTTLHEVYSRRISDRALALWMEKLAPYIGPELDRVLDEATTQRTMPTLGDLIQTTQAAIRRSNQPRAKGPAEWAEEDKIAWADLWRKMSPEQRLAYAIDQIKFKNILREATGEPLLDNVEARARAWMEFRNQELASS